MAKRVAKPRKSPKSRKTPKSKSAKRTSKKHKALHSKMESFGNLIQDHKDKLCHIDLVVGTNDDMYDSARKNGTPVFARVHAKWCGHCQSMKQDWEDLKAWHMKNVKDKSSPLSSTLMVSVEDTELPQVTEKYPELQADGFPTLMLVQNGKVVKPYTGPRNLEAFKTFMGNMGNMENGSPHGMRGGRRKPRKTRRKPRRKPRR